MPYTAEVSRDNPACFLFLLDQSASMLEPWGGDTGKTKAQGVATTINRFLRELVVKCSKSEGVRDYVHVGILTYGNEVRSTFGQTGRDLLPISAVAARPLRFEQNTKLVDDGDGGLVPKTIRTPVWFDPVASGGGTNMCGALTAAESILRQWVEEHPDGHPPIVINITDGEPYKDPRACAQSLKQLASRDGQLLLMNVHLSSSEVLPTHYPDSPSGLPDEFAELLFEISSPLPDYMLVMAKEKRFSVQPGAKAFAFNADMASLASFLDIGTRVAEGELLA